MIKDFYEVTRHIESVRRLARISELILGELSIRDHEKFSQEREDVMALQVGIDAMIGIAIENIYSMEKIITENSDHA